MNNDIKTDLNDDKFSPYRIKINHIDDQIISLLYERQEIAEEVGKIKKQMGIGIFDSAREEEVFKRLTSKYNNNLSRQAIRHIFSEIVSAARAVQQQINVAYLGPEATFSHQASIYYFGYSTVFRAAETIEDVFRLVEKGVCQQGVIPIENSYEGSVNISMDLLYKYHLKICAEILLRIRHHLISKSNSISDITKVCSHPMGIAQCRSWLKSNMPGIATENVESTSKAAKIAAEEKGTAAIGSRLASQTYSLNMLAENIEDQPDNVTRFLIIGKEDAKKPTGKDKTSILFLLNHRPGALYRVLKPLNDMGINMTRIESRPMKIRNWEYLFYADLEGHEKDEKMNNALNDMSENCAILKRLGSYPEGSMIWD